MLKEIKIEVIKHDIKLLGYFLFFFSSRRRHTRLQGDWSSDVCSSDLIADGVARGMVKVLTVPGKDRILGATLVGEHAGDLIVDRKSTRLNSSHLVISYAVFCLKKKKKNHTDSTRFRKQIKHIRTRRCQID